MESVARRGFFFSLNVKPKLLRRNRFSAASADDDRRIRKKKVRASRKTPKTPRSNSRPRDRLNMRIASHGSFKSSPAGHYRSDGVFAEDRFLDRACSDDPSLRNEVEALLRSHGPASTFLDPAPQKGLTAPDVKPTDGMIETSGNSFCRAINKRLMASTVRNYEARK